MHPDLDDDEDGLFLPSPYGHMHVLLNRMGVDRTFPSLCHRDIGQSAIKYEYRIDSYVYQQ